MKMKKISALILSAIMATTTFAACAPKEDNNNTSSEVKDITLTVWGPQEDQASDTSWLPVMCKKFDEAHPEWNITFKYGVSPEGDAAKNVTTDPEAAADVYFFANDQLGTLMQSKAISRLGGKYLDAVKADNTQAIMASVTATDGGVYGVPFTGNTWFMYYDKSVFSDEDIKNLDTMLEKGGVAFPLTNAWYNASFYVANGGTLFGENGIEASKGITLGDGDGVPVTEYLVKLAKNPNFIDDAGGAGLDALRNGKAAAMFSGTWDAENIKEVLGDNFGAAQLPTITINGQQKQLKAFAGSKAIAVNPHTKEAQAATELAVFLGSAEAQKAHYEIRGIIPSSVSLAKDEVIAADIVATAQNNTVANTAIVQPSIPEMSSYWGPAETMGKAIMTGEVTLENAAEKTKQFLASLNNQGL